MYLGGIYKPLAERIDEQRSRVCEKCTCIDSTFGMQIDAEGWNFDRGR
jgi:hypothetical protein